MSLTIVVALAFTFLTSTCAAQSGPPGQAAITPALVCPQGACVPDEKTAVRIAEAVLIPVYGEKHIMSERPFTARLDGDHWIVKGTLPKPKGPDELVVGGTATAEIDKRDGRILAVYHTK